MSPKVSPNKTGAFRIDLELGSPVTADVVVLATGNEAPTGPDPDYPDVPQTSYDGGSGFALGIIPSDEVLVIGTGPGAVDVARYLIEDVRILIPVHLISRGGRLSAVQTVNPIGDDLRRRLTTLRLESSPPGRLPSLNSPRRQAVSSGERIPASVTTGSRQDIERLHDKPHLRLDANRQWTGRSFAADPLYSANTILQASETVSGRVTGS